MENYNYNSRNYKKSQKKLFSLLIKHLIVGVATGWIVLTTFFVLDIAGLRTLAHNNHVEHIVYPLLYIFFAITFGSAAMGIGVMGMKKDDDDDDDHGGGTRSKVFSDSHIGNLARATVPTRH